VKLSIDDLKSTDPARAKLARCALIMLDGVEIKGGVIEADDEAGYIRRYIPSDDPRVKAVPPSPDAEWPTEELLGKVEISMRLVTKTLEAYFSDWESYLFGYGYGTGEEHVLGALKTFFAHCTKRGNHHDSPNSYDYREVEPHLTPQVTWLLINILCGANHIEYGVAPRYGWLTKSGSALKQFFDARAVPEIENVLDRHSAACDPTSSDTYYVHCMPDWCNCGLGDCRPNNPFWEKRLEQ
jgi:hypothetical protein